MLVEGAGWGALAVGAVEGNGPEKIQLSNMGRQAGLDTLLGADVPLKMSSNSLRFFMFQIISC